MNKKNLLGIAISCIGLLMIGYSIGSRMADGNNRLGLTFAGLFIVFVGVFFTIYFSKKKSD